MKFKVGDKVKVNAGDAKGKTGTVLRLLRAKKGRALAKIYTHVVVEGVNERKRNRKAMPGQPGKVVTLTKPIHISNVNPIKEEKEIKKNKKVNKKNK